MGRGLGAVQKAVIEVLTEAEERGESGLDVMALTVRAYKKLSLRPASSKRQGSWRNVTGGPLEQHYASVRRALRTLDGHGVSVRVGEEERE